MNRIRTLLTATIAATLVIPTVAYATHTFEDVEDGRFFTVPVEWAAENEITTGRTPTIFDPTAPVTRGESVTFLKRYHDNIAANLDTDTTIPNTDTLGDLTCDSDQVAVDGKTGWDCADVILERAFGPASNYTLIDIADDVGRFTSIAIGTSGNAIISHYNDTDDSLEAYACANTDCSIGTNHVLVDTGDIVGIYTSIAIGTNGNPIISHYNLTDGSLEAYACANTDCSTGTNHILIDTGDDLGRHTSIAIGTNGNPIISHNNPSDGSLQAYACTTTDCSTGTNHILIDTGDILGVSTSIAIGTNGNPIISHYNASDSSLEAYACTTTDCSTGTNHVLVDTTDDLGRETSIAIGTNGNPIISHYNITNGSLEVTEMRSAVIGVTFG